MLRVHMVKQGDIIKLGFDPQPGHEQAGYRPAIVVSNGTFNRLTNITLVCPITNTKKDFPTHVPLDERTETTGKVLCEHIKSVDLSVRKYKVVEHAPKDIFDETIDIIIGEVERE